MKEIMQIIAVSILCFAGLQAVVSITAPAAHQPAPSPATSFDQKAVDDFVKQQVAADTAKEKLAVAPVPKPTPPPAAPAKPHKPRKPGHSIPAAIEAAKRNDRLVLIIARQTTCDPCDALEHDVTNRDEFLRKLGDDFEVVAVNIDDDDSGSKIVQRIRRTPTIAVLRPETMKYLDFVPTPMSQHPITYSIGSVVSEIRSNIPRAAK